MTQKQITPLVKHVLALFTESYPGMIAQDPIHPYKGQSYKDCIEQTVDQIKWTKKKDDPSIYNLIDIKSVIAL